MLKEGFKLRDGLGKYRLGTRKPLKIPKNNEKFRLGYKLTRDDKISVTNEKREKRMARLESQELKDEGILTYDIKQTFKVQDLSSYIKF